MTKKKLDNTIWKDLHESFKNSGFYYIFVCILHLYVYIWYIDIMLHSPFCKILRRTYICANTLFEITLNLKSNVYHNENPNRSVLLHSYLSLCRSWQIMDHMLNDNSRESPGYLWEVFQNNILVKGMKPIRISVSITAVLIRNKSLFSMCYAVSLPRILCWQTTWSITRS